MGEKRVNRNMGFTILYQILMWLFAAFGSYRKGAFSMPVNQLVVGSIPTAGAKNH
jgi:hypothetical protein